MLARRRLPLLHVIAPIVCALVTSSPSRAQTPVRTAFTANDALGITSMQVADLSPDGRWLLATTSTRRDGLGVDYRRDTDPTYLRATPSRVLVISTRDGSQRALFPDARTVRSPVWSPDGNRVALLVLRGDRLEPVIWERASGRSRTLAVPVGMYVAEVSDVKWTNDGRHIVLSMRTDAWKRENAAEFDRMTRGPVFVQDGTEPFLAWDKLRRQGNVRAVYAIDVNSGRASELLPNAMYSTYQLSEDDSLITWQDDITRKTDYDVIFGTDTKLMARRLAGGPAMELLASTKGATLQWARDGRHVAWSKDGRVMVRAIGDSSARLVVGPDSATAARAASDTSAAARAARASTRYSLLRWSPSGDALLVSNAQGLWLAPLNRSPMTMVVATNDTVMTTPRVSPVAWSEDGRFLYLASASRTAWQRGVTRYDRTNGRLQTLVRDARLYANVRLARTGSTMVFTAADGNRPQDLFATDTAMNAPRQLTTLNPALTGKTLASTRLISYHDADGKSRYGVLYLPADYDAHQKYPTLFSIYEDFFDDTFDASLNVLTSEGYVVVKPSVGFETGFPGEAWMKGVTAAANHLVEAGIADSARLGVYGTSYGGYATNLLITQTNRFRAAVNVSGKVDMISFYTDSPRLGVRNIHAAEKSQDRLGATLWQQPQKYIAHSAIMFADRITTPLLLITGAQDPNVPADNSREMYYALRRLGKPVTWVNYMNSGHGTPGTTAEDFLDYHARISAFFNQQLKGGSGSTIVEATSLTGQPLYRPVPSGAVRERMESQLAVARQAYEHTPRNADSLIWFGRRTAYLGRFNDAIAIYTTGIAEHPDDARMYRHRGHRYLSTRQLELAVADFERAYALTKGKPDEVEPDGQPNARNIPTSTLQGNIRYHLGLAYYLKGDFEKALPLYREDIAASKGNPDMLVATSHWMYMALRRLNRNDEAAKVLEPISASMDIIENGAYHRLLLLYKGELKESDLLSNFGTDGNLEDITTAYGVGNWHLYNGRRAEADAIFARIVAAKSQWASFGYLTAEAERARLGAR
jgi:dipeptidyl aminopeptidase/acylaminoacyl peptidase/tetratricopeptide (TPR) repeat protein